MMETIKGGAQRLGLVGLGTVLLVVGGVGLAGGASAQTADPVADAFSDMNSKVTTYGAAIVALVVISVGIFLGIKYLRRGTSKA